MALKNKYAKAEEIPAELKAHYLERDGAWILDSERNEELRQTNITVMKERDALLKRFEGIDPDEVRKLAAEKARLEKALEVSRKEAKALDGRLSNAAFVEKAKPEAVEKARADHAMHAAEAERLAAALARLG